jgi:hypothetical protein
LRQVRFGLGDLVVELGGGDHRQDIAGFHSRADIDIAFRDIPAGAREDVCTFESVDGGGQCHAHSARACPHRGNADARNKVAVLLGSGQDLEVQRVMLPNAYRETAEEHQKRAESEQPPPGADATGITAGRPQVEVVPRRRTLRYAMTESVIGAPRRRHRAQACRRCACCSMANR